MIHRGLILEQLKYLGNLIDEFKLDHISDLLENDMEITQLVVKRKTEESMIRD